ncbi:phosphatidylinositol mannoside acyltransferase [Cellulomonas fengjieae]|uniref:Phosphatidylinositol mannoside acyltransferase n=1 Tax=Cellulomonas fengjieae TaxID=2819978 RepID=A0ABS3SKI4_9CELL|nr:phosphatidylinositol mannoside acyltransferase [Cellulomonas fengjieae]MBO3085490.1 phosphatidylinositol mannoside acyltransferase [Cellulomonas fengjieae]QVI64464.1 phosphatidylinositol mannoside acyltransferase [Cellulomonas fengjieae]
MKVDVARAYALGWRLAGRIPGPLLRALCDLAADATWLRRGGGVPQLEKNLARVRPDLDPRALRRLSRAGMRSYMRYFGEVFALATMSRDQIEARVRIEGEENLRAFTDQGQPVVLALGHTGNWDLAGAYCTREIAPVTTVAERLKPEELFQEFLGFRESIGITILPLTGGGDVFRGLVRAARGGPVLLPLLADRDLTSRGVEVDLLGERARVAAGPAALAITTGAPLLSTTIYYERLTGARRRAAGSPWGIVVQFSTPVELPADVPRADRVRVLTQAWVDEFAAGVRQHPQDWHMLQKVFVEDLDPVRYAATVAAQEGAA